MLSEEQLLQYMQEDAYKPLTVEELEAALGLKTAEEFKALVRLLNALEADGKIVRTRMNRYGVPERMNLVRGRLEAHPKGYGFVVPDDGSGNDIYIHALDMKGAMHQDLVLARVHRWNPDGRAEGEIVRIIKRANETVVGTYRDEGSFGLVLPDDRRITTDILIPPGASMGAKEGQKVVVRLTKYPERRLSAEGEVIEILGYKNEPGVDILSIIRKYDLPEQFPPEVLAEADAVPDTVSPEEIARRRDLRDKIIVTIDGEDAKDLDDAISVERLDNGHWRLGVHIADVSYYVPEDSALDKEAYRRGTSVYLVDRVIPMLPPRLSNGICSLHPRVDRLTITCEMEIDERGEVVRHDIFPSVIRTVERMTYRDVYVLLKGLAQEEGRLDEEDVFDEDAADEVEQHFPRLRQRYEPLLSFFRDAEQLARILRAKRMRRGAIDFDFPEAKILVDDTGKPVEILRKERTIAEQIIEEFMLAANETVAEHFYWMQQPFIYRVHEDPDSDKMLAFAQFIASFGYRLHGKANRVHPKALQAVLEAIAGTPEEQVISTVMLRSLKQARYDEQNLGHFGLAADYYTHFTSPIRRYPDLVVHRMIRKVLLEGPISEEEAEKWRQKMPEVAEHSSIRERIATEAERETDDLKMAQWMAEHIGETFDGIVSGVTSFGIFVQLPNLVEGMVHVSYMTDDYYHYLDGQYALIGERTGKMYRIGDEVQVRVLAVDVDERRIDFELVESQSRSRKKKKGRAKERAAAAKKSKKKKGKR